MGKRSGNFASFGRAKEKGLPAKTLASASRKFGQKFFDCHFVNRLPGNLRFV
jgi:hypothetical protein